MITKQKKEHIKVIFDAENVATTGDQLKELVEHTEKHEYFLGQKVKFPFSWEEAAFSWYENVYKQIRTYMKNPILRFCFNKQEIDIFFGISHEWYMISADSSEEPDVKSAVQSFIFTQSKKPMFVKRICELLI